MRYGVSFLPDLVIGAVLVAVTGGDAAVFPLGSAGRRPLNADSVARRRRVSVAVTIGLPTASSVRVRDFGKVKIRQDSVRLTVPTRADVDLRAGWRCVGFSGERKAPEALWLHVERERSVLCLQAPLSHLCFVAYAARLVYVSPFDAEP